MSTIRLRSTNVTVRLPTAYGGPGGLGGGFAAVEVVVVLLLLLLLLLVAAVRVGTPVGASDRDAAVAG